MKRRVTTIVVIVALLALTTVAVSATQRSTETKTDFKKRLVACGSRPNGSWLTVPQTTRLIINLPKDIYPTKILKITPHGAMASYISNGGAYGYSFGARGKPNCWSYYFEFDLTSANKKQSGTVDIGSKSVIRNFPNYLIHIKVVENRSNSTSPSPSKGTIRGQVLLGPICPVERIPPDPKCAPKPFITTIDILTNLTSSPKSSVATDASGRFALSLDPGTYVLRARSSSTYPRCSDLPVKVFARKAQSVIINCDTGIR